MSVSRIGRLRWDRVRRALGGGVYHLAQPIHNALLALVVTRSLSPTVWGDFIVNLLAVQLGALIADWGSREWLMRQVSLSPRKLGELWRTSLWSRLPLVFLLPAALVVLGWDTPRIALCAGWLLVTMLARSFDVLVVYRARFAKAFAVELTVTAVVVALVWSGRVASVDGLILTVILAMTAKVGVYAAMFSEVLSRLGGKPRFSVLAESRTFFLMGFSGWVNSRIDLYVVAAVLTRNELARYQILMGFVVMAQAIAGWSLQPFVKGLYRLRSGPRGAALPMALLGLLVVAASVPAILLLMSTVYGLSVEEHIWIPAAVLIATPFLYLPSVYEILRAGRATLILWLNLMTAVASAVMCIVFATRFGVLGAVSATAVAASALTAFHIVRLARPRQTRSQQEVDER